MTTLDRKHPALDDASAPLRRPEDWLLIDADDAERVWYYDWSRDPGGPVGTDDLYLTVELVRDGEAWVPDPEIDECAHLEWDAPESGKGAVVTREGQELSMPERHQAILDLARRLLAPETDMAMDDEGRKPTASALPGHG